MIQLSRRSFNTPRLCRAEIYYKLMNNEPVNEQKYRERVYEIVRAIPSGRVMTYGQLAAMLGAGYTPRTVGFVMHAADTTEIPWQRVINSQGACSTGKMMLPVNLQQKMLEDEAVKFDEKGRCDLNVYRWFPEGFESKEDDEQPSLFDNGF